MRIRLKMIIKIYKTGRYKLIIMVVIEYAADLTVPLKVLQDSFLQPVTGLQRI